MLVLMLARQKPAQLLYAEALLPRLSKTDSSFEATQSQLARLQAGYLGECRVDQEWHDFHILNDYRLFHNVCLQNEQDHPHQLDTLLLTTHFALILEIKNISGTLHYSAAYFEFSRVSQDGVKERFADPFLQALRHEQLVASLLREAGLALPVTHAVVVANANASISDSLQQLPIFHVAGLRLYLSRLFKKYARPVLTVAQLDWFSEQLLARHKLQPVRKIKASFKKGVLCTCGGVMAYRACAWWCSVCREKSKTVIYKALHDYRLLISEQLTNAEFRSFTGIHNVHTASKLLARLNLLCNGANKGRVYTIPENILERI